MRSSLKALLPRNPSRLSPRSHAIASPLLQSMPTQPPNPGLLSPFLPPSWRFSSAPAVAHPVLDHSLVADIFSKPIASSEARSQMESLDLTLSPETVSSVLLHLEGRPEIALRFFDWASECESLRLTSKCYNLMLEILGSKSQVKDFWDLVGTMKRKGFGISKGTLSKVSDGFEKQGMVKDLNLLSQTCFLSSHENMEGRVCSILRSEEASESGGEAIREKLDGLGVSLSSDLVVAVLERIGQFPKKALLFFTWVEGNQSFSIDGRIYNEVARVLGREDCIEKFWDVLWKMRNGGYELEKETFDKVSDRFHKRKMLASAVDLFQFAMNGSKKPSTRDFMFLLRKIAVHEDADPKLISKVVRVFIDAGYSVNGSGVEGILKSLRSVGKLGECDKILKAMEEGGFSPDSFVHGKVVIGLCDAGRLDEALQYLNGVEESGYNLDSQVWAALVQKHSLSGHLDTALSCFNKMVERKGGEDVGCALEVLVNEFCQKKAAKEAFKVLKEMVTKKNVKPWHGTYKFLIWKLIRQGRTAEAFGLLGLMKSQGFPPFIDPFVDYISKSGTVDDAAGLLKAMTCKEFPSRAVYLRLFEALFKEGRHDVAHDLLSKSPGSVRNHADVLDLFYAMKPEEPAAAVAS